MRPAKIQMSMRIRAVWSDSSLPALRIEIVPMLLHTDSDDSDQLIRQGGYHSKKYLVIMTR